MEKTRILLTGADGQLGRALRNLPEFADRAEWILTDVSELDITDREAVDTFMTRHSPGFIINCAAYTAVDQAEAEYDKALKVNAAGPENLAIAARSAGIPMIHISTDYVFSGLRPKPYAETELPDPQSAYGKSKLAGERAILSTGGKVIIIRTSWLYSEYGRNFFLTMLRLGHEKESVGVVADQVGSPTYAGDLATALLKVVEHDRRHPGWISRPEIFHFCNTGAASWYDLAVAIMDTAGLRCRVQPLTTAQYPLPALRPPFSMLDTQKFSSVFWPEIPDWRFGLSHCFMNYQSIQKSI